MMMMLYLLLIGLQKTKDACERRNFNLSTRLTPTGGFRLVQRILAFCMSCIGLNDHHKNNIICYKSTYSVESAYFIIYLIDLF